MVTGELVASNIANVESMRLAAILRQANAFVDRAILGLRATRVCRAVSYFM